MELVKAPVPVPSDVLVDNEMVGLMLVSQTTPRAVMGVPPSFEIVPPLEALEDVMLVIAVVDSIMSLVGGLGSGSFVQLRARSKANSAAPKM